MTWKPSEDMDREIRRWMKAKGWAVNCRPEYDFDREVYAWRHGVPGVHPPTPRICQRVLEGYPAFALLHHLDQLKVAAAIGGSVLVWPLGLASRSGGVGYRTQLVPESISPVVDIRRSVLANDNQAFRLSLSGFHDSERFSQVRGHP